jgi:uncharacterized membrane protein YccC
MNSNPDLPPSSEEPNFEELFAEVARSLQQLRERYDQVQRDQAEQQDLQTQLHRLEYEQKQVQAVADKAELTQQLQQIRQRLEELEFALESQLFSWSGLKEVFWQGVRFGGAGLVLGWFLRAWVG